MDREEIERQDFPAARRGYDPAAVEAHLRRVADEFDSVARRRPGSLAEGASTQVRSILEAAEASARQLRDDAGREASGHVERVEDAAKGMLDKLDRLQDELDRLLEGLKATAETLAGSLDGAEPRRRDARRALQAEPAEPWRPPSAPPRRPLRRRGRRAARRAQHGARGHRAGGDRPLPGRALRAAATSRHCSTTSTRAPAGEGRTARTGRAARRASILADLGHIHALLFWDQNTMMPPRGAAPAATRPRRSRRSATSG